MESDITSHNLFKSSKFKKDIEYFDIMAGLVIHQQFKATLKIVIEKIILDLSGVVCK